MNQTLVSPCPNCGCDASKHNKILYDGIFLICYNCGYGWYYNIEIFNLNKTSYEHKPYPTQSLDSRYNKNNISNYSNSFYSKNKKKPIKNISLNKKYNYNKNVADINSNKLHSSVNKTNNIDYDINYYNNSNKEKYSSYSKKSNYSNNIYYESNINNNQYTKKQSYNINNLTTKYSKPSITKKDEPIKLNNTLNSSLLNKSVNHTLGENNTLFNKTHKTVNTNNTINFKNTKNNFINIASINTSKLNNANLNNSFKTTTKPKIISEYFAKTIKPIPLNKEKLINTIPVNSIRNKNQLSYTKSKNTEQYANSDSNITNKNVNTENPTKISKAPQFPNKLNTANIKGILVESSSGLNYHNNSVDNNSKEHINNNLYAFNNISLRNNSLEIDNKLINKSNLGLGNINLLKFEEQANYNLKQFKVPLVDKDQLITSFNDFIKEIINNFLKIPQVIFTIFTRLDLFLKTFAYLIILSGTIAFLFYSYYKKQNSIKYTALKNTESKNETLLESNTKLDFQNNDFSTLNNRNNNIISNPSLSKKNIKVVNEKPEEKIVAFTKQVGENNLENTKLNKNINTTNLTNQSIEKPSFLTKIKATINNSLLFIKQVQINTFNKVKIYNNGFSFQGDYNNILVTHAIINNKDYKNSYLIRSLEVIFLEQSGKNIGKRIIIANQFINANSAVSINLKINNPPKNTSKIIIFIKDKKQL